MIGITPVAFTRTGINVDCPPYIFLPLICFAYCTGTLRSAVSINTIKPNITINATKNSNSSPSASKLAELNANTRVRLLKIEEPAVDSIPTKISIDNPLAIPKDVIFSPNQYVNIEPAISIRHTNVPTSHAGIVFVISILLKLRTIATACAIANANAQYFV